MYTHLNDEIILIRELSYCTDDLQEAPEVIAAGTRLTVIYHRKFQYVVQLDNGLHLSIAKDDAELIRGRIVY